MSTFVTRRAFLATSAGALALGSALGASAESRAGSPPEPLGPVPGVTGPAGLAPGSPSVPSRGAVRLLDGRVLEAAHATRWGIGPGRAVLLAPEPGGGWSVLYAEV